MGRTHAKYLKKLGIRFDVYDPGLIMYQHMRDYTTHAIIASPIDRHYENFRNIRFNKNCPILVEKPYTIDRSELRGFLMDSNVSVGLCLRYNLRLKRFIHYWCEQEGDPRFTVICSRPDLGFAIKECAIHYLDLLTQIYDTVNPYEVKININSRGVSVKFKSITIQFIKGVKEDYIWKDGFKFKWNETISPILLEQLNFFNGNFVKAKESHKLLCQLIDEVRNGGISIS